MNTISLSFKLVQKLGPTQNEEFKYKGLDHSDIFKEMLLRRLSLLCNFTAIDIPDSVSCCDWIACAVLLNESNSSSFAKYLNTLRKKKNWQNLCLMHTTVILFDKSDYLIQLPYHMIMIPIFQNC